MLAGLADASLCEIRALISDAEGAGKALSHREITMKTCLLSHSLSGMLQLQHLVGLISVKQIAEFDMHLWNGRKWQSPKKLHDESNGVSQHHLFFFFLLILLLSLSHSDRFQHLISDSGEKCTPSRSFSSINECAQMKPNTCRRLCPWIHAFVH